MAAPASSGALPLQVFCFPHFSGLKLPEYATKGAAGLDLQAAIDENSTILLKTGERTLVPTGIALQLPQGYEAQVRPRSGLALKHGITVLNSPGTIDWDYRGELSVLLVNHGSEPYLLMRGQRIAQLVVAPVQRVALVQIMELEATSRGAGGYGSTGV
ncbi:MAG: dUTP diphosphatase [Bosea sp. (in: a-proteobacteria)]